MGRSRLPKVCEVEEDLKGSRNCKMSVFGKELCLTLVHEQDITENDGIPDLPEVAFEFGGYKWYVKLLGTRKKSPKTCC